MRRVFFFLFCTFSLFADTPKAIIFDFGGVVAKVDKKPLFAFLTETLNKPYKDLKKDFAGDSFYIALEKPQSFWEAYAKTTLPMDWKSNFENAKKQIIREIPGMQDLIEGLKKQGIQVVLLSNTTENRARFIEKTGAYDAFDPILLSCYLGAKKPDPKIFTLLLNHLQWKASECLFIDNRKDNVKAAKRIGIDSIHFKSMDKLKGDLSKRFP